MTGGKVPIGQTNHFLAENIVHGQRHPSRRGQIELDLGRRIERVGRILMQGAAARQRRLIRLELDRKNLPLGVSGVRLLQRDLKIWVIRQLERRGRTERNRFPFVTDQQAAETAVMSGRR